METLTDIWGELRTRVRRFVGNRVNDPHTADDITQDVMLKLRTRLDTLLPEDKLPAWTIAVARNAVIDHYRARAVRDRAETAGIEAPAATTDVETEQAARELTPCLMRMAEQLPQPYRYAMKLVDLEGVSQQELADRLGVSLSGAKSRVQRARRQLRDMLEDCCDIEKDGRGNVLDFERTERSARYCGEDGGEPRCGR